MSGRIPFPFPFGFAYNTSTVLTSSPLRGSQTSAAGFFSSSPNSPTRKPGTPERGRCGGWFRVSGSCDPVHIGRLRQPLLPYVGRLRLAVNLPLGELGESFVRSGLKRVPYQAPPLVSRQVSIPYPSFLTGKILRGESPAGREALPPGRYGHRSATGNPPGRHAGSAGGVSGWGNAGKGGESGGNLNARAERNSAKTSSGR